MLGTNIVQAYSEESLGIIRKQKEAIEKFQQDNEVPSVPARLHRCTAVDESVIVAGAGCPAVAVAVVLSGVEGTAGGGVEVRPTARAAR